MHDMVRLGSEHALDIVVDVAENYTVPLATTWLLCCQWFDLEALQDRNWELRRRSLGLVEDGAEGNAPVSMEQAKTIDDGTGREAYFRAPLVILLAASPILLSSGSNKMEIVFAIVSRR